MHIIHIHIKNNSIVTLYGILIIGDDMKNKKGFTLIELLAVIIILGVIMLIAIPSVTSSVTKSRKNAYVTTVKKLVSGAVAIVNSGDINVYDVDTTYYIPGSCIPTETGGDKSPFAEWEKTYIVVTYNGNGFDYYWTSTDKSGMGIPLAYNDKINIKCIKSNYKSDKISTNVGIGNRNKIMVFEDDGDNVCESATMYQATVHVPDKVDCDYEIPESEPIDQTTTTDGLTWIYKDFKINFSKLTGPGCDNVNGTVTCYSATIKVENMSNENVIKSYEATFTIPSGANLATQYDVNAANVSINGSTLKIIGNPNNYPYRYLQPHDKDEYSFKFTYPSDVDFKLSNGKIKYDILNSDHQDGESSGDPEHISSTLQKLKVELDRTTIYDSNGYHQAQYNLVITNLSNESITDWSVVFDMPEEIVNFTVYSPLKLTKNNRRYVLTSANYQSINTIGPKETIGPYQVQFAMTDTNAVPIIS